jgi:hypothetical protein
MRKALISAFILLNLGVVLFVNRPFRLIRAVQWHALTKLPPRTVYGLSLAAWGVLRYAHLAGLDNRWEMFGRQSRFHWRYLIQAKDEEGRTAVLPLPRQSPRTFWQKYFFDFREAKFHLNLYARPAARQAYARYLCRKFPEAGGRPVRSIVFELEYQHLVPLDQAAARGTHLETDVHQELLDEFTCVRGVL